MSVEAQAMNTPLVIHGDKEDLGGFFVHRVLPGPKWRYVGPFVFFDHMGPMKITKTQAIDVRPHPHIGLATVTYLFEGRITHRDSIGTEQIIKPGDLNWMTAGKGIVHSERTPPEDRDLANHSVSHGIQIWVGLPKEQEECEPSFVHWDKEKLPTVSPSSTLEVKVMLGKYWGVTSPVKTLSPTLLMDLKASAENEFVLPSIEKEMGFYLVSGAASVNGKAIQQYDMAILDQAEKITLKIGANSRLIVIGGEPFSEPRYMWWNFVSSHQSRIEQASKNWLNQTMGKVEGEAEYAPLPNDPDA